MKIIKYLICIVFFVAVVLSCSKKKDPCEEVVQGEFELLL